MDTSHAGRMTEQVRLYRKAIAGDVSPEEWFAVGAARRAQLERLGDTAALNEGGLLQANVTHHAFVDAADDYEAMSGSRVLKHLGTGKNYWILRVVAEGRVQRDGRTRYMRLSLAEVEPAVV